MSTPRPPSTRSHSAPSPSKAKYHPSRPPPPRPDGQPFPLSKMTSSKRPKSILSRFRRVSQYDNPHTGSSELITIPTLEKMRSIAIRGEEEVDVDWEKVKTLPRVCLVPPEEDNGQTVTLYPLLPPPPRIVDIRTRESDDTSSLRTNGTDTSIWKGMAPGFILPPPVFSRRGQPVPGVKGRRMNVVMPKKRSEVVAERTRRLAREMIDGPQSDIEVDGGDQDLDIEAGLEDESRVDLDTVSHPHDESVGPVSEPEMTLPTRSSSLANLLDTTLQSPKPLLEAPAEILECGGSSNTDSDDDHDHDAEEYGERDEDEEIQVVAELLDDDLGSFESHHLAGIEEDDEIPSSPLIAPPQIDYGLEVGADQPLSIAPSPGEWITGTNSVSTPIPLDSIDETVTSQMEPPIPAPVDDIMDPMETPPPIPARMSYMISEIEETPPILPSMDLTAHVHPQAPPPLGSRDLNINIDKPPLVHTQDPGPGPATPATGLRKQKSLKQLLSFGYSSPPPPVPPLPPLVYQVQVEASKKRMTLLSRQSKSNLRIEVKSPKVILAPIPTIVVEREKEERPKMVKRFSLSSMSSAFKKMAGHSNNGMVPKVPDLPAMYRRKSDQDTIEHRVDQEKPRRRSEDVISFRGVGSPIVTGPYVESPICPLEISTLPSLITPSDSPTSAPTVWTAPIAIDSVLEPSPLLSQPVKTRLARSSSFSSLSSIATTASHEQQTLLHISPRTQRDPSASLQDFITQVQSTEVIIEPPTHGRQRSLEVTIVLSTTPPAPLPRSKLMEREDSLGNLSRSSHGSHRSSQESQTLKTPITMPVASMSLDEIRRHIPIAPPRTVETVVGIVSEGSFNSLPSLGSEMIVVNSPTSTLGSTSTGTGTGTGIGAGVSVSTSTSKSIASGSGSGSRSKPGSSSRASTPKARSLVRMITSPRRRHSRNQSKSLVKGKGKENGQANSENTSTPPPIPTLNSIKFDSLRQGVQLDSLHFESLNLDFSNLDWSSSGLGTSMGTSTNAVERR